MKEEWLECFEGFEQKCKDMKMVILKNERILFVLWLLLGLE
jgi:hypothetical protein